MGQLNDILSKASDIVWGIPLLVLLVGTGLYLTIRLGFLQFHSMGYALKLSFSKGKQDQKVRWGHLSLSSIDNCDGGNNWYR